MKKIIATTAACVLVLGLATGCDKKEREALQMQVTTLQQELTNVNASLLAKDEEINLLKNELQAVKDAQSSAVNQINTLSGELSQTKADLAKAQAELSQLKKKRR